MSVLGFSVGIWCRYRYWELVSAVLGVAVGVWRRYCDLVSVLGFVVGIWFLGDLVLGDLVSVFGVGIWFLVVCV
jgi:hypothetical protein